ncbi:hypothetical protein HYY75_09575, partial [bacterium]|nr:hypothetical protein [bacterium]
MIERLRFLFGFSKYLLPIILSALPIILLRLNVPEEKKRESEELKREWLSKSSKYVFRFREESKISFWLEETARRLKHNVLSSKIPFDGLSNFTHSLVSAIPGSYPKGVPKCKIWGVFISKKNSQPDAEICQDKLLEKECKKLVVSMMSGLSLDYSSNEDSDREFSKSNLVKRFKAAFGEGITSRVFDQDNRGIAYSVIFQGKPYLQLWDLIFQKQKIVGGFILMMPVGLNSSQNGPKICLLNWAKGPFFPAFIPFPVPGYDISSFPIGLHPKIRNSK